MTSLHEARKEAERSGAEPRGPLAGVTVIDLSWHLAGPYCTLILADLGASVIKVEAPASRGGYDPGGFKRHEFKGQDAHYMSLNRNKKSVTLNLKTTEGKELLGRLVEGADVLFNNFRAGVMERLGLGYEAMRQVNRSLIYASLTSFGQDGPYRDMSGVDLVVQALSGGMSMTGMPGEPPVRAGIPVGDLAGGMWASIAILSALHARTAGTLEGTRLDLSLLDGQIAMIPYFSAYYFLDGSVPGPQGSGGHSPTYGAFRCADDRYIVIAVIDQAPWAKLCRALQRPDWMADDRFATAEQRFANAGVLTKELNAIFAAATCETWIDRLRAEDVQCAPVNTLDRALEDPQVLNRKMILNIDHVLGGNLRFVDTPVHFDEFQRPTDSPPVLGQDNAQILGRV